MKCLFFTIIHEDFFSGVNSSSSNHQSTPIVRFFDESDVPTKWIDAIIDVSNTALLIMNTYFLQLDYLA
jgi:hypothetical protein